MRMVAGDVNNPLAEQLPAVDGACGGVEPIVACTAHAPCTHRLHIDIRRFIKKTLRKLRGSAQTIFASNLLGATCARVCPVQEVCAREHVFWEAITSPLRLGACNALPWTARAIAHSTKPGHAHRQIDRGRRFRARGTFVRRRTGQARPCRDAFESETAGWPVDLRNYWAAGAGGSGARRGADDREPWRHDQTGIEFGKDIALHDVQRDFDATVLSVGLGRTPELGIAGEEAIC